MNEELQGQLVKSIEKVTGWIEAGESMAIEQMPAICDEIVRIGIVKELVPWLFSVALCIASFATLRKHFEGAIEAVNTSKHVPEDKDFFISIAAGVLLIVSALGSLCLFGEALKPLLAPRLYILEQLANLF